MTTLVQQRTADDCAICAIAMATGVEYGVVLTMAQCGAQGYRPGQGVVSLSAVLRQLGHDSVDIVPALSRVMTKWLVELIAGRRALLVLDSLNGHDYHVVYWDGARIHDPSRARAYAPSALSEDPRPFVHGLTVLRAAP